MKTLDPAIKVIGPEKCTGCFSCYNACPFNAIEMKENPEGFYYPKINENCIECGVCQKFCPVINPIRPEDAYSSPKFYAGWSRDENIRLRSSSGGIFTEIARYILEKKGIVYGVALKNFKAQHIKAQHIKVEKEEELELLRGSKYLQSDVGLIYKDVIAEAKNRLILFSGTPCQVAALNTFLRESRYKDAVITVGVVCYGVPSHAFFKKYIEWTERRYNKKVVDIKFRDKRRGWENPSITIKFEDGSEMSKPHPYDSFFQGFPLLLRSSCNNCPFASIPRFENITLGDFWGVPESLRDRRGVSVILANTKIGEDVLEVLKETKKIELIEVDYETATRHNPRVATGKRRIPKERDKALADIQSLPFEDFRQKYLKTSNIVILRLYYIVLKILKKIPWLRKFLKKILRR